MHMSAHNVVLCNSHEVLALMTSYLSHILQWWARGGLSDSPGIKIKKQRACTTMIPHSLTRIHRNQASLTVDSPSETCSRKSGHMHPLHGSTEYSHKGSMWPGCHGNLEYHCAASLQMNVHWPKVHAQGENTTIPLRACSNFGVLTVFCNSFYRVITHAYICNKSSTPSLVQSGLSQSQEPVVRYSGHQNDHNYNLNATTVNEPFGYM